jgi:hypothetical protein
MRKHPWLFGAWNGFCIGVTYCRAYQIGFGEALLGGVSIWLIGVAVLYGLAALWDYLKEHVWKNPTPLGFTSTQWAVIGALLGVVSLVWVIAGAAVSVLSHRH